LLVVYKFILFCVFSKLLIQVFFTLYNIWCPFVIIAAVGSLFFGCIGALFQYKLKRFIGYTSINQIGYILLGLSLGTIEGLTASYNFIIFYLIVNTLFFIFLITFSIKNKLQEFIYISDLIKIRIIISNSFIYYLFIIIIAAILGLPPLANFFIKYDLFINGIIQF
jgi:NADH-quinone oxidoreductase subunit N